jgi:hypothetical protein
MNDPTSKTTTQRIDVMDSPQNSSRRRSAGRPVMVLAAIGVMAGVLAINAVTPAGARRVVTTKAFVALLCRYSDNDKTFNITPATIDAMLTGSPNSIDGIVREASLGEVNIAGSKTFGWFALPKPKTGYTTEWSSRAELVRDCAVAATAGGVNLAPFENVMVFVNDLLPGAHGIMLGAVNLPVNGAEKPYGTIGLGYRALNAAPLVLHELGHYFGAKHSSSQTDPLGGGSRFGGRLDLGNDRVANIGPTWDASNRDAMGWIPANRKASVAGGTQTITLSRLNQPLATGSMLVDVPIGTTGERYVVAARTRIGYDAQTTSPNTTQFGYVVPTAGVVIEKVSPSADTTTMFSTPGGNNESAAAVWLTGQTFTDPTGIRITVDRFDDNGAQVTITNGGPAPAPTTTAAPATTAAPTTEAPVTAAPTTAAPTATAAPTTAAPVTVPPTAPPTTAAPAPAPTGGAPSDGLAGAPLLAVPTTVAPFSNAGFGLDGGEPQTCAGIGGTVWFKVQAPASGTLSVNTAGSSFDTVLAVYSGPATASGFGELSNLGCVDDTPSSSQAAISIPVPAGATVYVQVGGYASATGTLMIAVG